MLTKRLKDIRTGKKLTLERLAQLTGLSKGYLSQVENSEDPPPIYTLSRISRALGIDIADLFAPVPAEIEYKKIVVARRDDHPVTNKGAAGYGYAYKDLAPNKRGKNMEPFIVSPAFDHTGKKDFQHEGEEFHYVLEGTTEFFYEGKSYCILEAGDSIYFDADRPHWGRSLGDKPAKVLIVTYSYKRL